MNSENLKALYEKLYFNEVDSRDKITARLQLPLTLIVGIIGAIAFLIQNSESVGLERPWIKISFTLFCVVLLVTLTRAIFFFAKALWNNEYYFLPDSRATLDYKKQCDDLYRDYENCDELVAKAMSDYIYTQFIECGSFNATVNDRRSGFIHKCNESIIATAILVIIAFSLFTIDKVSQVRNKPITTCEATGLLKPQLSRRS